MSYFKGVKKAAESMYMYDHYKGIQNININGNLLSGYPCDRSSLMQDLLGRTYASDDPMPEARGINNFKICVDINGKDNPNKWGVDRFVFAITEKSNVVPFTAISWSNPGVLQTDEKVIKNFCASTMSTPAHTCAYFALKNTNPEGKGDYWHDFLRDK